MTEVIIDDHGWVNLRAVRRQPHQRYAASEAPDGTITLVPLAGVHARLSSGDEKLLEDVTA